MDLQQIHIVYFLFISILESFTRFFNFVHISFCVFCHFCHQNTEIEFFPEFLEQNEQKPGSKRINLWKNFFFQTCFKWCKEHIKLSFHNKNIHFVKTWVLEVLVIKRMTIFQGVKKHSFFAFYLRSNIFLQTISKNRISTKKVKIWSSCVIWWSVEKKKSRKFFFSAMAFLRGKKI